MSFILREIKKDHHNCIILDASIFPESFIRDVINNSNWDHVYIINKSSRLLNYFYKNIHYKFKYSNIFSIRDANIVFFTFGNNFTNLFVNSIYKYNNIILAEDGIFPYYNMDVVTEYYSVLVDEPYINKIKRFIMYSINKNTKFNAKIIEKYLLFNPEWLPIEFVQRYKIEHVKIDKNKLQKVFESLNSLYNYKRKRLFENVDIIYFDSNHSTIGTMTEHKEFNLLCNIFKQLRGLKIYIKLRPCNNENINIKRVAFYAKLRSEASCDFVVEDHESIYPWEIVYYNNMHDLKDVIFIGPSFSTAFITSKKFHGFENNIICLRKLFISEAPELKCNSAIGDLIGRIDSTYVYKHINTPETYADIKDIVRLCV